MKRILVFIVAIFIVISPFFISKQNAISTVEKTNLNCTIKETALYWHRLAPYWKVTYKQQDFEKPVLLDVWGQYFAG